MEWLQSQAREGTVTWGLDLCTDGGQMQAGSRDELGSQAEAGPRRPHGLC